MERDFSLLAEYGFEAVRIFLMWEDFQPEIHTVSVRALDRLVQVANTAHDQRLRILPTFFCGHLSGINWVPDWLVESGKNKRGMPVHAGGKILPNRLRNMFADREVRNAQKRLLHETGNALKGHPAIWGWDLGNEITRFAPAPSNDRVRAWFEEMLNELKRWDAHLPVTIGIHPGDLEDPSALFLKEAAAFCDLLSLQALPPFPPWVGQFLRPWISRLFMFAHQMAERERRRSWEVTGSRFSLPSGVLNESDRTRIRNIRLSYGRRGRRFSSPGSPPSRKMRDRGCLCLLLCRHRLDPLGKAALTRTVSPRGFMASSAGMEQPNPPRNYFPNPPGGELRVIRIGPGSTWTPRIMPRIPLGILKHLYGKFRDWAGE